MTSSKKGISALQLRRDLGLGSYRTGWFMAHRIRLPMKCEPVAGLLKGAVQVDETYVGPRRHGKTKKADAPAKKRGRGTDKQPVMVLAERDLLKPSPMKLAIQAAAIIRASAKVGIIALVDEATGYQEHRAKNALQLTIQAFIADDLQEWARMFPQEFCIELARLEGVRYSPRLRPIRWDKDIMAFVYDAIDPDVGGQLRERNPNPRFLSDHHQ